MTIWIIAIANAVLWTGLFLVLLFSLMRGDKDISDRLDQMETRRKTGQPK